MDNELEEAIKNKKLTLCKEINPNSRPCTIDLQTGTNIVSQIPIGSLTHSSDRVSCDGEPYYDPTGNKHPESVVRVMYHISYMIRSEFIKYNHVPMTFDDMSCSIEDYEKKTTCFNPISGINHLVIRDDGQDDKCPMIPTRKKLVKGIFLKSNTITSFISHRNKIYLEIRDKEEHCNCDETYTTNYEDIYIRKINEFCHPISTEAVPKPSTMNLEVHDSIKVCISILSTFTVCPRKNFVSMKFSNH